MQSSLAVNEIKGISGIKEGSMSVFIIKNRFHSMNSSFRTRIVTCTCPQSPGCQLEITWKTALAIILLGSYITNINRTNSWFLIISLHATKTISSAAESTSCMHRRWATAAKELHRATEAEPKEEHDLYQA